MCWSTAPPYDYLHYQYRTSTVLASTSTVHRTESSTVQYLRTWKLVKKQIFSSTLPGTVPPGTSRDHYVDQVKQKIEVSYRSTGTKCSAHKFTASSRSTMRTVYILLLLRITWHITVTFSTDLEACLVTFYGIHRYEIWFNWINREGFRYLDCIGNAIKIFGN